MQTPDISQYVTFELAHNLTTYAWEHGELLLGLAVDALCTWLAVGALPARLGWVRVEHRDWRQTRRQVVSFVAGRLPEQVVGAVNAVQDSQHAEVVHKSATVFKYRFVYNTEMGLSSVHEYGNVRTPQRN